MFRWIENLKGCVKPYNTQQIGRGRQCGERDLAAFNYNHILYFTKWTNCTGDVAPRLKFPTPRPSSIFSCQNSVQLLHRKGA